MQWRRNVSIGSFHSHLVMRVGSPESNISIAMTRSFGDFYLKKNVSQPLTSPQATDENGYVTFYVQPPHLWCCGVRKYVVTSGIIVLNKTM